MFANKYLLANKLGNGSFGNVYVVKDLKTEQYKACKIVNNYHNGKDRTTRISDEIKICNEMSFIPEVSKIIDVCYDDTSTYLIQELYSGGTFYENKNWFYKNPILITKYIYKLTLFLNECHKKNIVYADIKPTNLMFDNHENKNMRIIDFGCSSYINDISKYKSTISGSLLYMAPDVINRQLSLKADSWSLGVLIYFIYTRKYPFWDNNNIENLSKNLSKEDIINGIRNNNIIINEDIPSNAMDLIIKLLNRNIEDRISISDALYHDYFKSFYLDFCI